MIISLNWLKQYVDIPVDTPTFVHDLTMLGLNVEHCVTTGPDDPRIVVGHVVERESHPNADRLSLCRVDVGDATPIDIVCGAPNVAEGQKVPVARVGAKLPGGLKIRKSKIRGVVSNGMICSQVELGLGNDSAGIMVLDAGLEPGRPFVEVVGQPDAVVEIEVTPNRPDQLSHLGVAREVAALYSTSLRIPAPTINSANVAEPICVTIDDPHDCYRFTGRVVRGIRVGPSPEWLRGALERVGLNSINNVVDIANYVMLELGQPLHAYDMALLPGTTMGVRRGRPGETIRGLDDNEYNVDERHLLITCEDRPVGVAGVIGGMDTRVTESTVDILIESAAFRPRCIRETRKQLRLNTDASYRFERGSDREMCARASARACELILQVAGGSAGEFVDRFPAPWEERRVAVRKSNVRRLLGLTLGTDEMAHLLDRLHFEVVSTQDDTVTVRVPSFRADILEGTDLVEEVARLHGYDRIGQGWSFRATTWSAPDPFENFVRFISDHLVARGHNELLLSSFTDASEIAELALPAGDARARPIAIRNPLTRNQTHLRTALLPATVDAVRRNIDRGVRELCVFARGPVFLVPAGEDGGLPDERYHLIVAQSRPEGKSFWRNSGQVSGFFEIRRELEVLALSANVSLGRAEYNFQRISGDFSYSVRGDVFARGGIVPGPMASARGLGQSMWYVELDVGTLMALRESHRGFRSPSEYPASRRDLSLVVPGTVEWRKVEKWLAKQGGRLLESAQVFDVYEGGNVPEGCVAVGVRLSFRSDSETLTDAVVDGIVEKTIRKLKSDLGVELRS